MTNNAHKHLIKQISNHAIIALHWPSNDYTPLLDMIGDAKYVLIGEALTARTNFTAFAQVPSS